MKSGTDESFAAFVAARSGRLIAHAELLCGHAEQARDIVQTVLTRAYPRWHRIEHDDPYGYLLRAVTNAVTDWWRRAHRRHESPASESLPEPSAPDPIGAFEDRQVLRGLLARLTARERAIVVLRHLDDRSEREVADLLGIGVGSVKSTCHKALRKLRVAVSEPETEEASHAYR